MDENLWGQNVTQIASIQIQNQLRTKNQESEIESHLVTDEASWVMWLLTCRGKGLWTHPTWIEG